MSSKKYLVHYTIEEQDEVIAFSPGEAAQIVEEEQGPNTKIISVILADGETEDDDDPPDDLETDDDDDGYGFAV
jgi:hypothetical protein